MGYDDLGKWDVDECCEKYWEVGGYEIEDEDLLDHCCFMCCKVLGWGQKNMNALITVNSLIIFEVG